MGDVISSIPQGYLETFKTHHFVGIGWKDQKILLVNVVPVCGQQSVCVDFLVKINNNRKRKINSKVILNFKIENNGIKTN